MQVGFVIICYLFVVELGFHNGKYILIEDPTLNMFLFSNRTSNVVKSPTTGESGLSLAKVMRFGVNPVILPVVKTALVFPLFDTKYAKTPVTGALLNGLVNPKN